MKILISGAGIAGLTTAYWLKRYGFTPTVVERAPALLTGGYKIDVRGSALQVLRRMGIYDAVAAASTDMQGAVLVDKEGKVINEMSGDAFGHRVGEDVEIIRGALCQILMNQLADIEFIFGESIEEIIQLPTKVQVTFQKIEPRTFDLIIGADGLHSNVRKLVFGDASKFLRPLGMYLNVFTVPNYLQLDRMEMQYSEFGRIAALWSAHGEPHMKACFAFYAPSLSIDLHDRAQQQQALKAAFSDLQWEVPKLLGMMSESSDFYFDIAAQIDMESWCKERVVLVGDAAYCASPMSGQGSSLALIGAYVLAGELAASKDYLTAFSHYDHALRSFVKINQALGLKSARLMQSQHKQTIISWFYQRLMQLMPGRLLQFFINRGTKRIQHAANAIELKDY